VDGGAGADRPRTAGVGAITADAADGTRPDRPPTAGLAAMAAHAADGTLPDQPRTAGLAAMAAGAALAFGMMVWRFGLSPELPAYGYLAAAGAALAVIDARERRLPDRLTLPSYPAALALLGLAAVVQPGGGRHFLGALAGLGLALALFLVQALLYPAGLGWGDVKLAGILGLYLGWLGLAEVAAGLFLGYLLAAVTGLGLIAAGRASRKTQLPFGPFLLAGTLAVIMLSGLVRG
jgi:leader peptidase (prepilin peptidase) / N-methyltransferase